MCLFLLYRELSIVNRRLKPTTGLDFDIPEAMKVGRRIINQLRVFNFRHGLTKDIEMPSLRYGSSPIDGPAKGKSIMPSWEALRRNYYQQMGWDPRRENPCLKRWNVWDWPT